METSEETKRGVSFEALPLLPVLWWGIRKPGTATIWKEREGEKHGLSGLQGPEWATPAPKSPASFWCVLALIFCSDRSASKVLAGQRSPKLNRRKKFWAAKAHPGCMLVAPPELGPRRLLSCSAARAHRAPLMLGSLFLIQDSVRGRNGLV